MSQKIYQRFLIHGKDIPKTCCTLQKVWISSNSNSTCEYTKPFLKTSSTCEYTNPFFHSFSKSKPHNNEDTDIYTVFQRKLCCLSDTRTQIRKCLQVPDQKFHNSVPNPHVIDTCTTRTQHGKGCYKNSIFKRQHVSQIASLFNKSDILMPNCNKLFSEQCRSFSLSPKHILDASPSSVKPYLRLIRFDKPIGTWLLYWPCTWSISLAAMPGCLPDFWLLALFGMGSFFMRGAGCIINDMWDKDYDKKVERTKLRPLASGELTQFQGLLCLGGMLSVSLGILLQLNIYSVILGASSMLLVILYPLAKRYTFWPQAMLGLTFNFGALLGYSAVTGVCDWSLVLPLYISCFFWTLVYDTIYAHQDKYDDLLIGVKSTALKFGDKTKPWLTGFATTMVSGITLTGYLCEQTWPFYTGVALTAAHVFHQIYSVDLNNADDCAKKFRSNSAIGIVLFLAIVSGTLLKKSPDEKEETKSKLKLTS